MDLSFARANAASMTGLVTVLPTELAVLLVGIAARQQASPTARMQARLAFVGPAHAPLAPAGGAFHALMAAALRRWKGE